MLTKGGRSLISDIIEKYERCSKCGNIQRPNDSNLFCCNSCDYQCVRGSNYWMLREEYQNKSSVEKLKQKFDLNQVDDYSAGLTKIKRAVENFESREQ